MRGNASRYGTNPETVAEARARLVQLLYCCRPHMLDVHTVDSLARTHSKVPLREIEYQLTIARQKRAGELTERTEA